MSDEVGAFLADPAVDTTADCSTAPSASKPASGRRASRCPEDDGCVVVTDQQGLDKTLTRPLT